MSKPRIISPAENEYTEALCWYAERSQRAAEGFDTEFDKALGLSAPIRAAFRFATNDTDSI
jgi:hypothetical protein